MKVYYSPSNNAFYEEEHKEKYTDAGSWPDDLNPVTEDVFCEFGGNPPDGKTRAPGGDGFPVWVDVPQDFIAIAEAEKQQRIDEANTWINGQQWPSKLVLGRLSEDETAQFNEWLDYLDAVSAVDTSTAPDIEWPTPPEQPAS